MINKHFYSLLFLIICNATHAMEIETSKQPIIFTFPKEIQHAIFSYAIDNLQCDIAKFQKIAPTCASLQLTCKKFAPLEEIVQFINIHNANKDILLMHASQAGIPCLVTYAIAQKANLNYIQKPVGYTPLSSAVRNNQYRCCEILLKAGADVNKAEEDEENITATSKCTDTPYLSMSYCPIHLAAKNNNLKITKLLIDHNVNVNATTNFNDFALQIAYKLEIPHKNSETIELMNVLIQRGAGPNWIREVMRGINEAMNIEREAFALRMQKMLQ
jgi:ankyrin repeat protein